MFWIVKIIIKPKVINRNKLVAFVLPFIWLQGIT